ncbi:NIPSNAP family protein [Mesorhizobium sp. CAU 1732]|uniref:NIPSNAP family protein n=1 Tax=Mesorhizobium sp. CAU 1732 TaxID=3140358 RepID=UPI0032605C75
MIHEWRSYRLKPGAGHDYLGLLADHGLPLVTRHLPLMGYWLAETGTLNTIHHLWSYADWAERETARAALAQEHEWTAGFIPKAFALVEEQDNCFLTLRRSSPAFDAALNRRRQAHPARIAGAPLYAAQCAALVKGATRPDAVAEWEPVSGDSTSSFTLLPRAADPAPATRIAGAHHIVLRPLAFSPL